MELISDCCNIVSFPFSMKLEHCFCKYLTPCVLRSRPLDEGRLRPVTQLDLLFGLDKMKESKQATVLPVVSEVPLD